ncbi:hypothetical protein M0813_09400 [Anaeramoeba flamelloides]|uniref:Uncharacterized protein n=1 Tax=Anaeramoeba flamelloides TaxID=1746091 RepID=A0ABQ8X6N9_9EUKA|nr:hypothetical protein M0813_09400 [Anaeramoeba flamelloides]
MIDNDIRQYATLTTEDITMRYEQFSNKKARIFYFSFIIICVVCILMSIVSPESLVTYEQVFEKNEQNKIKFIKDLGKFEPLNQELIIESVLVNKFNSEINQEVDFDLHISGYDGSKWVKLEKYQEIKRSVECKKKSNCTSEILVYEPFIKYHNYSIQLEVTPIKEDFFDKIYLRVSFYFFFLFLFFLFQKFSVSVFVYFLSVLNFEISIWFESL